MTLTGAARIAGVMGWPVAHSLSPRLHGHWLERHGIDGAYIPLPVAPEHVAQALRMIGALGFAGVNVTVPHKRAALAAVDEADPAAQRIGAVNTIVVRGDGSLFGTNTDATGFLRNLARSQPDFRCSRAPAVVVGAGGAARAALVALVDAGVPEVRLVNRTLKRAEDLALAMDGPIRVVNWVDRARVLAEAGLLVNTTTLGMTGLPALDLDLTLLPADAVVYDIVYNPLRTPLLAAAAARGNPVVDGLGMLLHQAVPGFAAWFGVTPDVDEELRRFVAAALT